MVLESLTWDSWNVGKHIDILKMKILTWKKKIYKGNSKQRESPVFYLALPILKLSIMKKVNFIVFVLILAFVACNIQYKAVNYPFYKTVLKKLFQDYDVANSIQDKTVLKLAKKPSGWHIQLIKFGGEQDIVVSDDLFWSSSKKVYQKISFEETASSEISADNGKLLQRFQNDNKSDSDFKVHLFYGYTGWEQDVINELEDKKLTDSLLYGLGRAYSSYATTFLKDIADETIPDPTIQENSNVGLLTDAQVSSYKKHRQQAIDKFTILYERNPSFETIVGKIYTKLSNEYILAYFDLKLYGRNEEAKMMIFDGLYDDFMIKSAKNYLSSCAPNAILFTAGDNDTYPLWYVQEKDNYRTDIRVCNTQLLNLELYIDQMKKADKNSEPLPISLIKDKYKQGTRDIIYLQQRINKAINLKDAIKFVASDNANTKINTSEGSSYAFLPSKNFSLDIDSILVVKNGTVSNDNSGKIEEIVEWKLNKNYLTKSSLILLDILATNQWGRPIYFGVTSSRDNFLGLDDFLQLEGLVYRFVPIKKAINESQTGFVNDNILLDNMMNKYLWWDGSEILNNNVNFLLFTYKNLFSRLSSALINNGKVESAIHVLDKCIDLMPHNLVPYNYFNVQIADSYFEVDQTEKANEIVQIMADDIIGKLDNFFSNNKNMPTLSDYELKLNFHLLQELIRITKKNEQIEIAKNLEEEFQSYYQLYNQFPN